MINKRLEEYRLQKHLKVTELAKIIGISHGSLSDIKNGKTLPRADTLEKIVRNTDINAHWLLTGEGPMLRTESDSIVPSNNFGSGRALYIDDPEILRYAEDLVRILKSDDKITKAAITINIDAFRVSVGRKEELESSHGDTDFKTQGSKRESKKENHQAGGR